MSMRLVSGHRQGKKCPPAWVYRGKPGCISITVVRKVERNPVDRNRSSSELRCHPGTPMPGDTCGLDPCKLIRCPPFRHVERFLLQGVEND